MQKMSVNSDDLKKGLQSELILGTVRFKVYDVLGWNFGIASRETLRSALVDAAMDSGLVHMNSEVRGRWNGEVELDKEDFVVTISAPLFDAPKLKKER